MSLCAPLDVFTFPENGDDVFDMPWVDWLDGATLLSVVWTIDPMGAALIELHTQSIEDLLTTARTWVRGKDAGSGVAYVTASVVASDAREWSETWRFDVCAIAAP